jgi:tripartite-type tricarboxylate transporter receptor subunit TctC
MRSACTWPLVVASRSMIALALVFALSVLVTGSAGADDYPNRPVKIIVPFAAGGTADAIPRLVGDWLSRKWGQPVVIENRTGAAGNIGADFVYHSDPDGYTLLSSPPPPLVINQNLYPKLGFDPAKFEPVIVMAQVPNALIVNPKNLKASSVSELIDYLQQNPEKVTAATQGIGTTSHLTAELFQVMAKVKLRTIPYRGSAPALAGLLAGDVDLSSTISVFPCPSSRPAISSCSPWHRASACRRFRKCRPSPKRCPASRPLPGSRSRRHRRRRKTSPTRSMPM